MGYILTIFQQCFQESLSDNLLFCFFQKTIHTFEALFLIFKITFI
jgi:hypothetical protein